MRVHTSLHFRKLKLLHSCGQTVISKCKYAVNQYNAWLCNVLELMDRFPVSNGQSIEHTGLLLYTAIASLTSAYGHSHHVNTSLCGHKRGF